ncbi:MAG: phenylacetate--CoA ligase family protein [Candidatus Omnitrophica bacterium]|nr:phenylacetate--CoA ligase family protein [Candidatus Omnitrophota bacterium]
MQLRKLNKVICYAAKHVPYYRDLFKKAGLFVGKDLSLSQVQELYSKIPVSSKDDLLARNVSDLITREYVLSELKAESTSGSSGKRFDCYLTRREFIKKNTIRLRSLLCSGYNPFLKMFNCDAVYEPRSNLLAKLCVFRKKAVDGVRSPDYVLKQIMEYKPSVLVGFPSNIREIAKIVDGNSLHVKTVIALGEMLDAETKRFIEEKFLTKVKEHYGAREVGRLAFEDSKDGKLYLNEDAYFFEVNNDNELIVTTLDQFAMPLIKYNLRDIVEIGDDSRDKPFRHIISIQGRKDDFLVLKNDDLVSPCAIINVITLEKNVKAFRVVQDTKGEADLFMVVHSPFSIESFTECIRDKLPGLTFRIMTVNAIPKNDLNKFKAVICNVQRVAKQVNEYT